MPAALYLSNMSKRICIAKIATAHGIRGLVKLHVFADDKALVNGALYTSETGDDTLSITLKNATSKHWLAEVDGIQDRNEAEALRGTLLYIDRDVLPTAGDGEFYISDLIDLPVVDVDGNAIGTIIDVANFGAGDLLEIKPTLGESFYLPFNDDTVPEIREEHVVIAIPEGLLE